MEKLNATGKKLIEYKHEFQKSDSQIVRDALVTSLDVMIQQGLIDEQIKNEVMSDKNDESLTKLLELNQRFRKGPRELYKEYEKIRTKIDETLKSAGLQGYFETESSIEFNRIAVLKQFSLNKDFILDYFGIAEIDLIQLMKKRGFAEKFAVLRLNLIFDEILQEVHPENNILQGHSLVYYNPDITGFSIDYKYYINIDVAEDDNARANVCRRIAEIDRNVDNKFRQKTGINFYTKKRQQKNSSTATVQERPTETKVVETPKPEEAAIKIINNAKQPEKSVRQQPEKAKQPQQQRENRQQGQQQKEPQKKPAQNQQKKDQKPQVEQKQQGQQRQNIDKHIDEIDDKLRSVVNKQNDENAEEKKTDTSPTGKPVMSSDIIEDFDFDG